MKSGALRWDEEPVVETYKSRRETLRVETWTTRCGRYRVVRVTHDKKRPYATVSADFAVDFAERFWQNVTRYCRGVREAMRACQRHARAKDGPLPRVRKADCRVKSWPTHEEIYRREE